MPKAPLPPRPGAGEVSRLLEVETYRSILHELPIAIMVLEGDGTFFDANAKLVELSGYSREELVGGPLDALIPEALVRRHRELCKGFRVAPRAHQMGIGADVRLRAKSGVLIPVAVRLSALKSKGKNYILASIFDLTEVRKSQAERDEVEKNLGELNRDLEAKVEERTWALVAAHARTLEQRQLQDELEMAGQIQLSLLPKVFPLIDDFDFTSRARPSRFVSGDFYDYKLAEDGSCSILLADISGKGLPAALLASSARSLYRRVLRETSEPGAILRELNHEMLPDLELAERFITMITARLDPKSGSLEVANAGGCSVIVFDDSLRESRALDFGGLPIGLFPYFEMDEVKVGLRPGMGVLIYSDGITEAENPRGELFGTERLLGTVARASASPPEDMAAAILSAIEAFAEGFPVSDDATFVVLKAKPRSFRFGFVTSLASLDEIPARVASACFAYGEAVSLDMELSVSEVLANIRKHGYDSAEGPVTLELGLEREGIEIVISERGKAFDPSSIPPPQLGEAQEEGFGLYLINETMDNFSYKPGGPDGNLWTLFRSAQKGNDGP